jgi:predicted dehydrogenase
MDRRTFVATTAAAAAATLLKQAPALGADKANDKIVMAVMGMGGQGTTLATTFEGLEGVELKAVYDVDKTRAAKGAEAVGKVNGRKIGHGQDFRAILDDQEIDAMVIATCNHWHAPATLMGCAAGKHIYVEKPCSHNPREGELMVAAAKKYDKRIQQGTQRRSRGKIVEGLARLRQGVIGRVYYAHCYYRGARPSLGVGNQVPVPDYLDFDLWQGPAPRRPYKDNLLHYNWHWRWHWGNGELGNNEVHFVDIARAGLGVEFPIHVTSTGGRWHWQGDDQETPDTQIATFKFADEKALTWEALSCNRGRPGDPAEEIWFYGETGSVMFTSTGYTIYGQDRGIVETQNGAGGLKAHLQNFIDAIRNGSDLAADIEIAHRSALLCHLGNIAYRTGRALACNPADGTIVGDEAAMALWTRQYEPGWEPSM